jgi:hypothetical protein
LTVFHAPFVFDLTGFCGIASGAGVPLVTALFAARGLLRLRETRRTAPNQKDDHQ